MGCFRLLAGVAALAAVLTEPALAQWNNEPYQFRNSGGGGGFSPAYRQAMLNKELFGREPDNLVRGPDGRLLDVIERDQQAYLVDPEPNFYVPAQRFSSTGGISLFLSAGGGAATIGGWTSMLDGPGLPNAAGRPATAASPIDSWINQLD